MRRRPWLRWAVVPTLLMVGVFFALRQPPATTGTPADVPPGAQSAVVERIVDGDTFWVHRAASGGPLRSGERHKIRLLEIDSPETSHPELGRQCGGQEASDFAADLLPPGSTVWLAADVEDRDRYDRFLRYAWTADGAFYNEAAVRMGHARAVLYEPNDAYIDVMRAAEAEARGTARGIWGPPCSVAEQEETAS